MSSCLTYAAHECPRLLWSGAVWGFILVTAGPAGPSPGLRSDPNPHDTGDLSAALLSLCPGLWSLVILSFPSPSPLFPSLPLLNPVLPGLHSPLPTSPAAHCLGSCCFPDVAPVLAADCIPALGPELLRVFFFRVFGLLRMCSLQ